MEQETRIQPLHLCSIETRVTGLVISSEYSNFLVEFCNRWLLPRYGYDRFPRAVLQLDKTTEPRQDQIVEEHVTIGRSQSVLGITFSSGDMRRPAISGTATWRKIRWLL